MATALEEVAALPEPIGEVIESSHAAQRAGSAQGAGAAGGDLFHLRIAAERHGRRRGHRHQERQRGDPAGRQGSGRIESGHRGAAGRRRLARRAFPRTRSNWSTRPIGRRSAIFCSSTNTSAVAIPRGGEGLIRRVAAEAKMPVIKHFTGNCHIYVDRAADLDMAEQITINAKCQRMGVCNAAESLVVHSEIAPRFLPRVCRVAGRARRRNSRRHALPALRGRRRCRPAKPTFTPSIWGRRFRSKWSIRWTRRSSTSIITVRSTPTRS